MKQRFRLSHFPVMIMLVLLAACSQEAQQAQEGQTVPQAEVAANPEMDRLAARAKKVTIIRDDFGVPHIYGKTDADVVFGLLYAQAEDDFNRVERNYVWAI